MQDYRELAGENYDAVASIGMVEHVGESQIDVYAEQLASMLRPGGRLLDHGISRLRHGNIEGGAFSERYVFPDGETTHVSRVILALERAGFVVQHVEEFGSDYAETLRHWIRNLDENLARAEELAGPRAAPGLAPLHARGPQRLRDRLHVGVPSALPARRRLAGSPPRQPGCGFRPPGCYRPAR